MTVHRRVDVERIATDRNQLWAEGLGSSGLDYGVRWQEAERLPPKLEHQAFKVTDPWDDDAARWLSETDVGGRTPLDRGNLEIGTDVLVGALGFEIGRITYWSGGDANGQKCCWARGSGRL